MGRRTLLLISFYYLTAYMEMTNAILPHPPWRRHLGGRARFLASLHCVFPLPTR